jgi:drug/metabolite transporter (DMT)-like permease
MSARRLPLDRSTLCGFLAILLWSTTIALARSLSEQLGPLTSGATVYLVGGVLCLLHLRRSIQPLIALRRLPRLYLIGCGALFVLYMFALFEAIGLAADRSQVLEVGMVNYLWPSLTILFSLLLLGKKGSWLLIPGSLLALLGVFLVLTQETAISWTSFAHNVAGNPLAYGLALTAALSWGLYSNLTRRWAGSDDTDGGSSSSGGVAFFMLATGAVLLLLRLFSAEISVWNPRAIAEVLFLGLATSLAYVCWDVAMRRGDIVLVGAASYFTPFLSTLTSCLYLQIATGPGLWLGCFAIIVGSLLSWRSVTDARESPTPENRRPYD